MAEETSPKDLIKVIRGNKGLTVIALGAAGLLILYLYKQSKAVSAGSSTATATTTAPSAFTPAMGSYTYVEDIHQGAIATPPSSGGVTATPIIAPPVVTPVSTPKPTPAPVSTPIVPIGHRPPPVKAPVLKPTPAPSTTGGLLGSGIRFFPNYKNSGKGYYRGPNTGGKIIPIPLPANTTYQPGADGRVYYQSPPGSQGKLLGS